jgi:hypothetical protein
MKYRRPAEGKIKLVVATLTQSDQVDPPVVAWIRVDMVNR